MRSSILLVSLTAAAQLGYKDTPYLPDGKWRVHDLDRPRPPMVAPGATPGAPPSDAIVLFDGKSLDRWNGNWKAENGELTIGTGSFTTKESFGDIQMHIEWRAHTPPRNDGQNRSNSGVMFMGRYELQVLDSWENPTYADGQAASVYGQYPPLVNASRKPGEWQTYDLVFEAPKFEGGYVTKQASITLYHNGVLVQNHRSWIGQVAHRAIRQYEPHAPELPLTLQDHNEPVRFRNIWVRRLKLD